MLSDTINKNNKELMVLNLVSFNHIVLKNKFFACFYENIADLYIYISAMAAILNSGLGQL